MFERAADVAERFGYSRRAWPHFVERYLGGRVYHLPGSGPTSPALVLKADVEQLLAQTMAQESVTAA
jgi:hypothetical protein